MRSSGSIYSSDYLMEDLKVKSFLSIISLWKKDMLHKANMCLVLMESVSVLHVGKAHICLFLFFLFTTSYQIWIS